MDNTMENSLSENFIHSEILAIVNLSAKYCSLLEDCRNMTRDEFIEEMLRTLPAIYLRFYDLDLGEDPGLEFEYFPSYVDEDFYESVRLKVEGLMGPDDVFLETFEEDMKYSDTPIAASISESLADIFQALYNFISAVRESDGEQEQAAYRECRENFVGYWSQTLCNVLRALNHLRFSETGE